MLENELASYRGVEKPVTIKDNKVGKQDNPYLSLTFLLILVCFYLKITHTEEVQAVAV